MAQKRTSQSRSAMSAFAGISGCRTTKNWPNSDYRAKQMDARAFKILKALLGCGRSPDKAETTGPNQKQTKSEADNDVRCCHSGGGAMASTMSRIRPTMAEDSAAERWSSRIHPISASSKRRGFHRLAGISGQSRHCPAK